MAINLKQNIRNAKTYFFAASSVSKPIAFLMMFFGLSFVASVIVGVFLLGQWGYDKVVNVDKPVIVSSEPAATSQKETSQAEPNVTITNPDKSNETSNTAQTSTPKVSESTTLPDTGTSLLAYVYIALLGSILHSSYVRFKR